MREIVSAAERASALTHQLLAYAGNASLEVDAVDLSDLLREMARLLRAAVPKSANLTIDAESGIWVRVHGDAEVVRLTVTDDGQGASHGSDGPAGYGLPGLAERAALLGGTFKAGPGAGRGWLVEAVLRKVPGQGAKG